MPLTIRSFRTYDRWQQDRQTPRKTYSRATASVAAPEPIVVKSGGWASLMASAHEAYARDRQMTTDERVEMELRKLAQNKKHEGVPMSGTTVTSQQTIPAALTVDALMALDERDTRKDEMDYIDEGSDDGEEVVPSMNYAVAELAKSLEESRKALRKTAKDNEILRRETNELRKERQLNQDLQAQLRKFDNWVSPAAHTKLRTGWEEWADVAEKKIESLQAKLEIANEENEALLEKVEEKDSLNSKLEERLKGFQDWTSPLERKVLDATIDMLNDNVGEMEADKENCPTCVQRQIRAGQKSKLHVTKPVLGRNKTVV
jgi:hypothetical protein